jgi:cysteinyl-tRNA synthetase
VNYVRNITDVDDKIIEKARKNIKSEDFLEAVKQLTYFYTNRFHDAMDKLGLRRPNTEPRATEHIPEMVSLIQALEKNGFAYNVGGDVYFDIAKWKKYGALSGRSLDDMKAGARVEVDSRKKSPLDFALWKKVKPEEPAWESPWGKGRPGWHIECSAMSMKFLGAPFDIHGGGQDLIFPHHENELAQSEAGTGKEFARFWMHNGFVTVDKEKMSKSLGNFFILQEVYEKFAPRVVKYYLLTQHYRSPIDFSDAALAEAQESLKKIENCLSLTENLMKQKKISAPPPAKRLEKFEACMNDDFNTPNALAIIHEYVKEINKLREKGEFGEPLAKSFGELKQILNVLGIQTEYEKIADISAAQAGLLAGGEIESLIQKDFCTREELEKLAVERVRLRKEKNFTLADAVRKKIESAGFVIEDTPAGARLRKK